MFILGVIPARGGSKRIPRKNIVDLNGKPLIWYSISEAQKSILNDVVVSTEDAEIKSISLQYECEVIDRPEELAQDSSPTPPVITHAISKYESKHNVKVDAVMILQITSPLRNTEDINNAIEAFIQSGNNSLISVTDGIHPVKAYDANKKPVLENVLFNRQKHGKCYVRNGAIFITDCKYFVETGKLMGDSPEFSEMPKMRSVDVDELEDFRMVEAIIQYMEGRK